jgi:diguanylate cyclase (GGDEF)-like protein
MSARRDGKPEDIRGARAKRPRPLAVAQAASGADQTASESDQTSSDADQTSSDADQTASERDDADATRDQVASDADQRAADTEHPGGGDAADRTARKARQAGTLRRLASHINRTTTALTRGTTAVGRDVTGTRRDKVASRRDFEAEAWEEAQAIATGPLRRKIEELRAHAAEDRRRAAADRAASARARARLEAELHTAHLDDLTGAYRREVGMLTLKHEMDRAHRAGGHFVIAFVDIDGMKQVNDRDGHLAGDHVLQTLVWTMRSKLRSFDPVLRYGGDEFVAGLGGMEVDAVARRFESIEESVEQEVGVGFSVGLAELQPDETLEHLIARADAGLLEAKGRRSRE